MKLSSADIIGGCAKVWFVPIHTQWGITEDTRKYKFTNRLNITNKTNIVWGNSHNTNNKVIVIYYIMSKIVIIFEKQIPTQHQWLEWEPLATGEFVDLPPLVPQMCALSALILSLSSSLMELILKCSWILFLNRHIKMSNKFRMS